MNSVSPLTIPFAKFSACGNDFLIVEGDQTGNLVELTRKLCDRHNGVGADGVEWLFPATDADIEARLLNADGSAAEISGNGTRCVAAALCSERPLDRVTVKTGAGLKTCVLTGRGETLFEFETAMGTPRVDGELTLQLAGGAVTGTRISIGNPHFVVFFANVPLNWRELGHEIGARSEFEQGVNVEFVSVRDSGDLEVKFFERGVGETQSSGTGSCAAAVAAITKGRSLSPAAVYATGGGQLVRWDDQIYLRGWATLICKGEFFCR
jgi:diaminopimelate epimerase